jgi:hypothetical protein
VRAKEDKLVRLLAKDGERRRPQDNGVVVRTAILTPMASSPASDADVLDHGVMPRDELLRQLSTFQRSHAVSKVPIDVHVTPTL